MAIADRGVVEVDPFIRIGLQFLNGLIDLLAERDLVTVLIAI